MRWSRIMSIEWVAGLIALISVSATVVFILRGVDVPREWWMILMTSVTAKIFGSKSNGGGRPDAS